MMSDAAASAECPQRCFRRRIRNETRTRIRIRIRIGRRRSRRRRTRRRKKKKKQKKKIKRKEDMHPFLPALVKGLERAREGHPVEFKDREEKHGVGGWVGGWWVVEGKGERVGREKSRGAVSYM